MFFVEYCNILIAMRAISLKINTVRGISMHPFGPLFDFRHKFPGNFCVSPMQAIKISQPRKANKIEEWSINRGVASWSLIAKHPHASRTLKFITIAPAIILLN